MRWGWAALAATVAGCSSSGGASVDAGSPDAGLIAAPAAPVLTPCPPGWREVTDGELTTCDPWPVGGPRDCAADEAHFPGEPGCARVGSECPAGEWPEGLPAGQPIRYVRAGGPAGGDGSQAAPFGTIAEAMAGAPPGTIIALAKGTFDEAVVLAGGVTLWGACVAMTRVASSSASTSAGTLTTAGMGAQARNLQVGGERPGVWMVTPGASLQLEDVVVADVVMVGLFVANGAQVTGDTIVVRDTRSVPGSLVFGRGLNVQDGAHVDLSRVSVERSREAGVFVGAAGTTVALSDLVVRDTLGLESNGTYGEGVLAIGGAHLDVSRAALERNRNVGVIVAQVGTMVTLSDVVIRDTASQDSDGRYGRAFNVEAGGQVELSRALLERNREVAVYAGNAGTTLVLTDVVVRDTLSQASDLRNGRGLDVELGAHVAVTRGVLARNRDLGVYALGAGSTIDLTDVTVSDTESRDNDGTFGRGLGAAAGARLSVTRGVVARNRDLGVYADSAGTNVVLTDVVVSETRDQACAGMGTCGWVVATGVGAYNGAAVSASRFRISAHGLCGVQLALGGTVDLQDGEVAENPIAANVQTVDFDVTRLQNRVLYRDNDVNLDASGLPIPGASP